MANKKVVTITINADGKEVRETAKDVERLSDGLHDLDVRQAREAQEALKALGNTDLNQLTQDLREVRKITADIDDKQIKDAQRSIKEFGTESKRTAETYTDANGRMRDANGKFVSSANQAKNAVDKLGNGVRNASADFGKLAEKANAAGEKLRNTGQSVRDFGTTLTAAATVPILGLGVAAVKSFADVELAVARISTIKPEIDTTRVREALNEMSTRVPQAANALGEGLYNIFSSINVTQVEGLKLLEDFSKGATAAETDAKTFGTAVLGVMNAYKLSVQDAAHISDVFFNTVNLGVINGAELASELGSVTTAAKQAGVSFDELGALIVGVTKEGGSAAENINRLNNFLQKLPTSGADIKKLLNVDVKDGDKFRSVIDVLTDFKLSYDKLSQTKQAEVLQKIFPDAQAREGAAKLLSQLDAVKEALEVNKTTSGAAEKAYQKIAATASVQFTLLKNTTVAILSELGSAILPVLQPLIIWIAQNLVPAVKEAVESFKTWSPQMQTVAVGVAAFIASLGPMVVIIGVIITAIGAVVEAIGLIGSVIGSVSFSAIIGPALAVVGVLAAIGVAAYALYQAWTKNIGGIQEKSAEVFNNLKTIIQPAVTEVSAFVQQSFAEVLAWVDTNLPTLVEAVLNIVQKIQQLWADHGEQIKSIISSAWNIVKTIISTVGSAIGNIILLVANAINGNWSGAWENFKAIIKGSIDASISILGSLINIVWQILKAVVTRIISIGGELLTAAYNVGKNIVQGLVNGIGDLASRVYEKAKEVASSAISMIRGVFQTQSPSRVTTEIGENVSQGLANGIENRTEIVKSKAKKLADETIKILREAAKEFEKIAGMSPEQIARTNRADELQQAVNDLKEIQKLRKELGVDQYKGLPDSTIGASAELRRLQNLKKAADDYLKSLDEIEEGVKKTKELIEADEKAFQERKAGIPQQGEIDLIQLQKEISLLGVTDELEKIRINNIYELKLLREQMINDGYAPQQIDEIVKITELEQGRLLELQRILQVHKQILDASNLEKSLKDQLFSAQNNGRELSEYEKTLRKLNEDFKDISPAQREQILNTAAQVDAQKKFNDEYQKTYDFIRGALDILTDKGKSFGDKMKAIFGGVFDSFKKMLLDITAQSITTKLFGGSGNGSSATASSSEGFSFWNIIKKVLGGGSSANGSTPPFVPSGSSSGSSSTNNILTVDGMTGRAESYLNMGDNTSPYTKIKQLLGKGGIFGQDGFGFNSGTIQGIGGIAGIAGDAIGGTAGSILSGVSSGIGAASSLSTILGISALGGPIGLAVGAVIGGLVGLGKALFGRNKQRKADEKTRDALMVDTLKQLNEIKVEMDTAKPGINFKSLVDNALQLQQNYYSQANALKDKKTRNIAIKDGRERVDPLVAAIQSASEAAKMKEQMRAFGDERDKRIIPMFNSGVFMDDGFASQYGDFKRRNGLLQGAWTGRDTLPSMLAMGEMVLNPMQQYRVIQNAGFDVFNGAGIPNYRAKTQRQGFAEGVNLNSTSPSFIPTNNSKAVINFSPNLYLNIQENEDGGFDGYLESEDGQKKVIKIYTNARKRKEII